MTNSASRSVKGIGGLSPELLFCVLCLTLSGCAGDGGSTIDPTAGVQGGSIAPTTVGVVENSATENTPIIGAATARDDNLAPSIDAISLGCDLVLESIAVPVGETTNFTLIVDDESPLTLTYSITSDDFSISDASVDGNGVFALHGLKVGTTTVLVTVTDENAIPDQILLSVIVQA